MNINSNVFTGWIFTDAIALVMCPRCLQNAGKDCRQPKGRKSKYSHTERVVELSKLPGSVQVSKDQTG